MNDWGVVDGQEGNGDGDQSEDGNRRALGALYTGVSFAAPFVVAGFLFIPVWLVLRTIDPGGPDEKADSRSNRSV